MYMYDCVLMFVILSGAFGYFEVTHDITRYCKAKVFSSVGKRTPIAVHFSTVGEWGGVKVQRYELHVGGMELPGEYAEV